RTEAPPMALIQLGGWTSGQAKGPLRERRERPLPQPAVRPAPVKRSVAGVLEALAGLQLPLRRSPDRRRLAGPWGAAGRRLALRDRKRAETDKADFVAFRERTGDGVEHPFHRLGRIAAREAAGVGDGTDQFVLVHVRKNPLIYLVWIRI